MDISLEQTDATVVACRIGGMQAGECFRLLLMSDLHIDSVHCDRVVLQRHLQRVVDDGAYIAIAGDVFDAMQGRFDPRRSMDDLRPEYRRDDYYDYVVNDVARWLAPYAERIILLGLGNHETAVLKNAGTDLTERLVHVLRTEYGSPVVKGAASYAGWLQLRFKYGAGGRGAASSVNIRYAHSAGGGNAPVTRGVIQTNRQAVYLENAHIVWNGHNHKNYLLAIPRERVTQRGRVANGMVWFVRTPGYKRSLTGQQRGYAVEKGHEPTAVGSVMVQFVMRGGGSRANRLVIEPVPWIEI